MLVTGGSRGIGAATCLMAAKHGYAVAVNYHSNQEAADAIVKAIEKDGGKAIAVQADVANEQDVVRLFAMRRRPDKCYANSLRVIAATVQDVVDAVQVEEL